MNVNLDELNANQQQQVNQVNMLLRQRAAAGPNQQMQSLKKLLELMYFLFVFLSVVTGTQLPPFVWVWMIWYLTLGIRRFNNQVIIFFFAQIFNLTLWLYCFIHLFNADQPSNSLLFEFLLVFVNLDYLCTGFGLICAFFILLCLLGALIVRHIKTKIQDRQKKTRRDHFFAQMSTKNSALMKSEKELDAGDNACSICLLQDPKTALPCSHTFHETCIKMWLDGHDTCPICRQTVY